MVKATFGGAFCVGGVSRKAANEFLEISKQGFLGANIFGEEWALKAYQEALADQTLTGAMRQAVERQYALSQKTYDRLTKLQEK